MDKRNFQADRLMCSQRASDKGEERRGRTVFCCCHLRYVFDSAPNAVRPTIDGVQPATNEPVVVRSSCRSNGFSIRFRFVALVK